MILILQQFIDEKTNELKQSNLYRDVEYINAYDIDIKRNGQSEGFFSTASDLNREIEVIDKDQSNLGNDYIKGVKVRFSILEKRKRNYSTKSFHVIYK